MLQNYDDLSLKIIDFTVSGPIKSQTISVQTATSKSIKKIVVNKDRNYFAIILSENSPTMNPLIIYSLSAPSSPIMTINSKSFFDCEFHPTEKYILTVTEQIRDPDRYPDKFYYFLEIYNFVDQTQIIIVEYEDVIKPWPYISFISKIKPPAKLANNKKGNGLFYVSSGKATRWVIWCGSVCRSCLMPLGECTSCPFSGSIYLVAELGWCFSTCPATKTCISSCDKPCKLCSATDITAFLSCTSLYPYYWTSKNKCYASACPDRSYRSSISPKLCSSCHDDCNTC
jgi:hypothetical protein